jgi:RNA polymerase sigma-70 factor (ECF subfamily)
MGAATEITNAMSRNETAFDIDAVFCTNYGTVARIIARVVRDHARAEELAVEVFLRLWRDEKAQGYNVKGWLYRVAVRAGVDELRRRERRTRYESLFDLMRLKVPPLTPEQIHSAKEEQARVRHILSLLGRRQAEFLVLQSRGFRYEEISSILGLNPVSVLLKNKPL